MTHLTFAEVHASHVVRSTGSSSSPGLRLLRRRLGCPGCIGGIPSRRYLLTPGEPVVEVEEIEHGHPYKRIYDSYRGGEGEEER